MRQLSELLGSGEDEWESKRFRATKNMLTSLYVMLKSTKDTLEVLGDRIREQESSLESEDSSELLGAYTSVEQDFDMFLDELKNTRSELGHRTSAIDSIDGQMMELELESLQRMLRRLGSEIEDTKLGMKSGSRVTFFGRAVEGQKQRK